MQQRLNWTTIALIGGLVVLVLLVAYFATNRNSDQDKLTGGNVSASAAAADPEKRCASKQTYNLIKRDLFRRASQLRGSDQAAFDKLSAYAAIRMENPVMESGDDKTGAVNCSASLSLDLPPGVAVVGGRKTLMSDIDYTVQPAADGSGMVVLLRNIDAIISPLATLARVGEPAAAQPVAQSDGSSIEPGDGAVAAPDPEPAPPVFVPPRAAVPPLATPAPANQSAVRPSFNCDQARTKGEIAVCSDGGLATLDRNMAAQYRRAITNASPEQQALLRRTRDRFLGYRDRCPNRSCISDSYVGRMREIRDIMDGSWQAPR